MSIEDRSGSLELQASVVQHEDPIFSAGLARSHDTRSVRRSPGRLTPR